MAPDHTSTRSHVSVGRRIADLAVEVPVLMALTGHRHSDVESGIGTVFNVITAADCLIDMGKIRPEYSLAAGKKTAGIVNEQTIDYVSISKDHSKVTMKRIGYGYDRIFNVRPVEVPVGKVLALKPSFSCPIRWFVFDSEGNEVVSDTDSWHRRYLTSHKNASISVNGDVQMLQSGSAIAVALYEDGTKEYFMITTCSEASR